MATMKKPDVLSQWPGFPLAEDLERYLWLDQITPVQIFPASAAPGSKPAGEWLEIRGIVKPGLTIGPDGEVTQGEIVPVPEPGDQEESYIQAHRIRESLMGWANTAIMAAEDMGYRHDRHPEIMVTGEVRVRHREPEKPDTLCCKVEVRMWLAER